MMDDPILFWSSCLLWLIVVGLVFGVVNSDAYLESKTGLKCDSLLQERLQQLSIADWKTLRQKSGLTTRQVMQVRRGKIEQLPLHQLQMLAVALNWSIEDLTYKLGILSSPEETSSVNPEVTPESLEIEQLHQQCQQLQQELQRLKTQERHSTFSQLQTLLTNYPTLRRIVEVKPDLPAKNLLPMLTPLENLLNNWGYQSIGSAWQQVSYSPQLHQPDTVDIQPGELVYIRLVGYRDGERILCPAKVSRTLPGGKKDGVAESGNE